ncbi:unnamed protein product [Brachionus calyciflorus]|uniref:AMP-activated protein kinase glycogen-binding domain-containing protein n=1 Tax=Brachionus calyciflorus TaxID=104777 RepID=A0A813QSV0_9BILA|nr:unnamed protein product [Brachionus calyciflorus]
MNSLIICFILFVSLQFTNGTEIEFNIVDVPRYFTPLNDDIFLSGSFNNWSPNHPLYKFKRLSSNLFKLNIDLPLGTYQYKFTRGSWSTGETSIDGSFFQNRNLQITSTTKQTHLIKISNWDDFKGTHTITGNVYILHSKFPYPQFNTTKSIWIYLPPDYYTSFKSYPVLYMHDAQNLFDKATSFVGEWGIDEILESNFLNGKETAIVVGLETKIERMDELTPYSNPTYGGGKGEKYVDFLINDLKPYIDRNYRTKPSREFTGIAGSSLGGLMSFYAGLKNQNIFSKLGVFSPSFWFNSTIHELADSAVKYSDTKIYMVCGEQEGSISMVDNMFKMVDRLTLKGYNNLNYFVRSYGTHSEWFWNKEFPNAFDWLFG